MARQLLLLLFFAVSLHAQSFKALDTLGVCREQLNNEYQVLFKKIKSEIVYNTSAEKKILNEIYDEMEEDFIDKIGRNTFICNNDIKQYIDGLLNDILSKNAINKTGYKILLSRDADINAYCTGYGTIVLNYGLFTAVENEDELVYVICHEIGHQELKHSKQNIAEFARLSTSEEIIRKTKEIRKTEYRRASLAGDLYKRISYRHFGQRRKYEIQADSIGYVFYKKTGRSLAAPTTLLEKFDNADREKDSLSVADYKRMFDTETLKLKSRYFEEEQSLFANYNVSAKFDADSLKTHPACAVRIAILNGYIGNSQLQSAATSDAFSRIKDNAAYQNLYNLYYDKDYGQALYETLKLYKHDTGNAVLKRLIYLNLTKLHIAKTNYTLGKYIPPNDRKHYSDSYNRFILFINNIKLEELKTIANNFTS